MTMAFTTCSSHSGSSLSYGIADKPVKASLGFMGQDLGPVIVMGVSGSGKTTLGTALAKRLGVEFIEGDSLHPPENIAKMSAGTPLTDADRWPWLANIS